MGTIRFVSHKYLTTIGGVSAWSFEDSTNPVLLGHSDASGLIDTSFFGGTTNIRFMAYGHSSLDETRELKGDAVFNLEKNHPGSYSGFLIGSDHAIWHNQKSDRYFEFTAYGNFRTSIGYRSLIETHHVQYRMSQNMHWYPPGPTVKLPNGGKKPPLPLLNWSYLGTRDENFPTVRPWKVLLDLRNRLFRFPTPGVMIVNSSGDSSTNDGEEYKLLN